MPDSLPPAASSWRINLPDVSAELVEGEVVAIHLPSGMYFSLRETAATIWEGIEKGADFAGLVQALTAHYEVAAAQAGADAAAFLEKLTTESLVAPAPASGSLAAIDVSEKKPYAAPVLEKFSDLQDLLLLDPIHEVDQRGWPHEKPE